MNKIILVIIEGIFLVIVALIGKHELEKVYNDNSENKTTVDSHDTIKIESESVSYY